MIAESKLKRLARRFLALADNYNAQVNAIIAGCDVRADLANVCHADRVFTAAYNEYYGESRIPCMDCSLAESLIY